ncbi:MAG: DNA-3-methyladenine glycosylase 2 family protein [Acidimicrobiia bacterium]|nr:DNA-3-methyladenine glycosylase 2 family protein [Acidimicrobiia bacterium]
MSRLTEVSLAAGVAFLVERDPDLAGVVERFGSPPLWDRGPGFPTLLKTVLEQQVSLASAAAAYGRLLEVVDSLTPEAFLALDDLTLRQVGFSRQKTHYGRVLAQALLDGSLDLTALEDLDDREARDALTSLKGIGRWTADTYLLMALLRPDVWPAGDIALQAAVQDVKGLPARPTHDEMIDLAEVWRPWRAVAARILWFHYLEGRG